MAEQEIKPSQGSIGFVSRKLQPCCLVLVGQVNVESDRVLSCVVPGCRIGSLLSHLEQHSHSLGVGIVIIKCKYADYSLSLCVCVCMCVYVTDVSIMDSV